MAIVNIEIPAQVDAGKPSLPERILIETGALRSVIAFHLNELNLLALVAVAVRSAGLAVLIPINEIDRVGAHREAVGSS
jgi:hypothetical protein